MAPNLIPHDAGAAITYRDAVGMLAIIQDAGEQATRGCPSLSTGVALSAESGIR